MGSLTPRLALVAILLAGASLHAAAQVSPQSVGDTTTGARPGNQVGTGMSLPMGTKASNIGPGDSAGTYAPNLPAPALPENARPSDFLRAAQGALAAGCTGEAQQALEMAQTRLLDRSVPLGQTNDPSNDAAVRQISQALRALSESDRAGSMQQIQSAMASAAASGN